MSLSSCHFCELKSPNCRPLYSCPRCQVRYCSVSCFKHPTHSSCSESFYRQCLEDERLLDGDKVFDQCRAATLERQRIEEETMFSKKKTSDASKIFDFSADKTVDVDENSVNEQLHKLGVKDPNDVEELLDALTDEEKEHFLRLMAEGRLEGVDDEKPNASKTSAALDLDESQMAMPWWSRCSGPIIAESVLEEDLPPRQSLSDILDYVDTVPAPTKAASTISYDILNSLTAYCLVLRESAVKNFWSATDHDTITAAATRVLLVGSSLSGLDTFQSSTEAIEKAFYMGLPNEDLRLRVKSDLVTILKNYDWRRAESGRSQFAFVALCDLYSLFRNSRKFSEDPKQKRSLFGVCKKLEFYMKWAESNGACWKELAAFV